MDQTSGQCYMLVGDEQRLSTMFNCLHMVTDRRSMAVQWVIRSDGVNDRLSWSRCGAAH